MGKNQAYKAMQRSRVGSTSGGPDDVEDGMGMLKTYWICKKSCIITLRLAHEKLAAFVLCASVRFSLFKTKVDGSFHSPEWHAARLASLKTSHTVTWEEYKKKQKEEELKKGELEADKDRMMREYRAQLDAERASKLAHGRNHSKSKSSHRKDKKDKDLKKRSNKKRKRKSSESSSSSSSSESLSSDDDSRESKRSRSKKRKDKRHRSKSKHLSGDEEVDGPLPLSRFFGSAKG